MSALIEHSTQLAWQWFGTGGFMLLNLLGAAHHQRHGEIV
jgi:hypothetical protein